VTQLIILGAGGHGAVVAEAAVLSGNWSDVAFWDDSLDTGTIVVGCPVIGDTSLAEGGIESDCHYFVAFGDNEERSTALALLEEYGATIARILHPSAVISPTAIVGNGTVVCAGAVVNARANIGSGAIVNTSASVDHDCNLGRSVHVSPGANLAGGVTVGDESWVGIGASIREGVSIGSNCIVGAGSAVLSDVESGQTVAGVPARKIGDG
jgi:sugar O-acyltransferase (sialic acid O-acetyltransferase NeuD family)